MKVKDREFFVEHPTRQALTVNEIHCILPYGMKAVDMGWFSKLIMSYYTPAYSFNQKVRLNDVWLPILSIPLLVEECIHLFQERRMGKVSYFATYFWQMLLSAFRGKGSVHNDNLMEREAMRVAKEIAAEWDYNKNTLDIQEEIFKRLPWEKWAKQ